MTRPVLTFLTDFGLQDPFVGIMHGVVLSRAPDARIIDLSHGIRPQDVTEAAFWLDRSQRWFPPGSVHVAVVDPGVGSQRAALAVAAQRQFFVAPDNGLLGPLLQRAPDAQVHHVDTAALGLEVPSRTFHGRDVFAPVGALLLAGTPLDEIGPKLPPQAPSAYPRATLATDAIDGVVVAIDHFGNLITNIDADDLANVGATRAEVGGGLLPLRGTYSEVSDGELLALINSFGTLEIAQRNGNAAKALGLPRGAAVRAS